jgi:hypothetical protein
MIAFAREQYLDDYLEPYLFSDPNLAQAATMGQEEACTRADLLFDATTQTANNVATGTATGTTTNKLVDSGATFTDAMVGMTVYNTTDNTVALVTARDSATQLSLSADIMASGEAYVIGDATQALTVVGVQAGTSIYPLSKKITKIQAAYLLGDTAPLVQKTEAWLDRFVYNWRMATGQPRYYLEEDGLIRLVPAPDSSLNNNTGKDLMRLEVYRLPLKELSIALNNEPEISSEYHYALIHWMCFIAFQKPDTETQDLAKSAWHERKFDDYFGARRSAHDKEILRVLSNDFTITQPSMGLGDVTNQ